jgi:hypothetical protein
VSLFFTYNPATVDHLVQEAIDRCQGEEINPRLLLLKLRVKQTADHLAAFTPEEKWQFISLLIKELEL